MGRGGEDGMGGVEVSVDARECSVYLSALTITC